MSIPVPLSSTETDSGVTVTFDFGSIGVVGVVDQLSDQLDALGVKPLADGDEMTLVDGNREITSCFWSVLTVNSFGSWL